MKATFLNSIALRILEILNGRVRTCIAVRVLKIAIFEGSGFLGSRYELHELQFSRPNPLMPSKWQMTSVEQPSRFKRCRQLGGPCSRIVKASQSGDSWIYPDPNLPCNGKSEIPTKKNLYCWAWVKKSPRIPSESTINTIGTLFGVHPIVR